VCQLCATTQADVYCTCLAPPTYMCMACLPVHHIKAERVHHVLNVHHREVATQTSPEAREEDSKQTQARVLADYEIGPSIYSNSQTALSIHEGKRKATNESVIIKTYESPDLVKVNEQLKEGVI